MTYHSKYKEVLELVKDHEPVLLEGTAGTGKTTIAKQIAEELDLELFTISWTRQTTVNNLIGFINLNNVYCPTRFRTAVEHGGVMLWDELDAADPNVVLVTNTLENGYMDFPDRKVEVHPNFHLIATCNPQNQHALYTGRSKLDFAVLDRFERVSLDLDLSLEASLTSPETSTEIAFIREIMEDYSISKPFTMRDARRYHKNKLRGRSTVDSIFTESHHVDTFHKKIEAHYAPAVEVRPEGINGLWEQLQTADKPVHIKKHPMHGQSTSIYDDPVVSSTSHDDEMATQEFMQYVHPQLGITPIETDKELKLKKGLTKYLPESDGWVHCIEPLTERPVILKDTDKVSIILERYIKTLHNIKDVDTHNCGFVGEYSWDMTDTNRNRIVAYKLKKD